MDFFKRFFTITIILASLMPILAFAQTFGQNLPQTTPTNRFTDNGNGTVTDKNTGLMWKVSSEGQVWGNIYSTTASTYTWQGALLQAQAVNSGGGYAGYTDWRVPNIKELKSIVERQCIEPSINLSVFYNTPNSGSYWSSSPNTNAGNIYAWCIGFQWGDQLSSSKTYQKNLRLVRGG